MNAAGVMNSEFSFEGVFLSSALVSALIAFAAAFVLKRALGWLGVYRIVWHPALFDTALFIILWAAVISLPLRS
jgi:hypothetical protein